MVTTSSRCYYWLSGDSLNVDLLKRFIKGSHYPPRLATLFYDSHFVTHEESRCCFSDISSISISREKVVRRKSQHSITTNKHLNIVAKQRSLTDLPQKENKNIYNRRRSETYLNANTAFSKLVDNVSLFPKKVPSQYLLEHLATQPQSSIHPTQHKESASHSFTSDAMYEVKRSVEDCHKKYDTKVKKSVHFLHDEPNKDTIRKSSVEYSDLLSPLAGLKTAKRKTILKGSPEMSLPQTANTNSLITIDPNTEYLTSKTKVASDKAKWQKPYETQAFRVGVQPVRVKIIYKKETLESDTKLPKAKTHRDINKAQPVKTSSDDVVSHELISGDKTVAGRKRIYKVKKIVPPSERKGVTEQPQQGVTENRKLRTVTTLPLGTNASLHENTQPVRETAMKPEMISSKKSPVTKLENETHRFPFEVLGTPFGLSDASLTSVKVNKSGKKRRQLHGKLDYSMQKDITSSVRNISGNIKKTQITNEDSKKGPSKTFDLQLERKTALDKQGDFTVQAGKGKALTGGKEKVDKSKTDPLPSVVTTQKNINARPFNSGFRRPSIGSNKEKLNREHSIFLPEMNTNSGKDVTVKISTDTEFSLVSEINSSKQTVEDHGFNVPFQEKIAPRKANTLRKLVHERRSPPEGRREFVKPQAKKAAKENRLAFWCQNVYKSASGLSTLLEEKALKPKFAVLHSRAHTRTPTSEENPTSEMYFNDHHYASFVTKERKCTESAEFVKNLPRNITPNEDNGFSFRDSTIKDNCFSQNSLESETLLSVPVVPLSVRQYIKHRREIISRLSPVVVSPFRDVRQNIGHVPYPSGNKCSFRSAEPEVNIINKIEENKWLRESFGLRAKETYIKAESSDICSMRKNKTVPQKDLLKVLREKVVRLPSNRLTTHKYINVANTPIPLDLDLPLPPDLIPYKEVPNKLIKEYDKCKSLSTTADNDIRAFLPKPPKLGAVETVRPFSIFKDKTKGLNEKLFQKTADDILQSKNTSSHKIKPKGNVIKNVLKPEYMALGDFVLTQDKKIMLQVDNTRANSPAPAMYAKSLKNEAAGLYAPSVDTEYMSTAQKKVLRILKTYLENIEADLLSEFE